MPRHAGPVPEWPVDAPRIPVRCADAGKTAHYMLRWVRTTEEKGPWSETAGATVEA
jgi:hypothetical protein